MDSILLTDDQLKRRETRFGPLVRQMGPWNSDVVFGYAVSNVAPEKATETVEGPKLPVALPPSGRAGAN